MLIPVALLAALLVDIAIDALAGWRERRAARRANAATLTGELLRVRRLRADVDAIERDAASW